MAMHPRNRKLAQRLLVLILPAAVIVLLFHIVAPLVSLGYSFTDRRGVIPRDVQFIGLDNYTRFLTDPVAQQAFVNTVVLAAFFVLGVIVLGLMLAVALNQTLRFRGFLRAAFFLPVALSPLAVSHIWRYILASDGPLNQLIMAMGGEPVYWLADPRFALWAILMVVIWQNVGYAMVILLAGLQAIPEEILEAASMDGAMGVRRFFAITLPLLAPAMTIAIVLMTMQGLRLFDQIVGLTGGGPVNATETLTTQLYRQAFAFGDFGFGSAIAVLLTILVLGVAAVQATILRRRDKTGH